MSRVYINDMEIGETYTNFFLLKSHQIRQTQKGQNYLDCVLTDKTAEIPAKLWNISAGFDSDALYDGCVVTAQFITEEYQGAKQAKLQRIMSASDSSYDMSEIIPTAPIPAEDMWNELMDTANGFSNQQLTLVVTTALKDNKEEFYSCPGAKSMHHAVLHGLMYHTVGMLRCAKGLCDVYADRGVNKDLLLSGVILHDIAKIKEFDVSSAGLVSDYSKSGKLLGHIYMGARYVANICARLKIDQELSVMLQHMILSHHGVPEFGSPQVPMFVEADILHYLDIIDAHVYMFLDADEKIDGGTFSPKVFGLEGRQVYKPTQNATDPSPINSELDENGLY